MDSGDIEPCSGRTEPQGRSSGEWYDHEQGQDDLAMEQLDSDFARYFLAQPDAPPNEEVNPEPTFEDLLIEAETTTGADRIAARARCERPGSATALMLDAVVRQRMSATGLLDAVCAAERLASWTQAVQHRFLAAFARPGVCAAAESLVDYASAPGQPLHHGSAGRSGTGSDLVGSSGVSDGQEDLNCSGVQIHGDPATNDALNLASLKVAAAEVAAALLVSPISANRRVSQAVDIADGLPATLSALQCGSIDRGRSLVIADRTQNLPAELRRRVESVVVHKAATRNAGQLRGIVDRAVIAADPAAAKKRQEAARRNRGVSLRAGVDGMSAFRADLPADKACTAFTVIDQIAVINSRRAAEDRSINALRADAVADIFDQLADHGSVHLHTILRSGHTNVDPSRPCPNYPVAAEPATCAKNGASAATDDRTSNEADSMSASHGDRDDSSAAYRVGSPTSTNPSGADVSSVVPGAADGSTVWPGADLSPNVPGAADGWTVWPGADVSLISGAADGPSAVHVNPSYGRHVGPARGALEANTAASPVLSPPALTSGPASKAVSYCRCHEPTAPAVAPPTWGLGTHQGRATGLNVTIAATTLAGLDELPGELDGHGTIPADLARALAASAATMTAVAVNPSCGTALDLGRTVYRPRQAQRDYVNQRDQTCRFPSCRQPSWRCQLDHSDEFCPGRQDGGVTCPCNLACLCKFHHDLKTFGLWDSEHHPDDSITFTSPTGRTYLTHTREWLTGMTGDQAPKPATATTAGPDSADGGELPSGDADDPPF